MRSATITMSVPNGSRAVSVTLRAAGKLPLYRRVADAIQSFARSRGVAPIAVEYSIVWGQA